MNERTTRLRRTSLDAAPSISHERAELITDFYRTNEGRYSVPVMRARSFLHLCEHKTIYLGEDELIVGERGPRPKAVPTYPELIGTDELPADGHRSCRCRSPGSQPAFGYLANEEDPARRHRLGLRSTRPIPSAGLRSLREPLDATHASREGWGAPAPRRVPPSARGPCPCDPWRHLSS